MTGSMQMVVRLTAWDQTDRACETTWNLKIEGFLKDAERTPTRHYLAAVSIDSYSYS
jgi:hypothetical protein